MAFSITNSRKLKKTMALMIGHEPSIFGDAADFDLHGIQIRIHFQSAKMKKSISDLFPLEMLKDKNFSPQFEVFLREGKYCDVDVWDDADPECEEFEVGGELIVVQRDFLARQSGHQVVVLTEPNEGDGFHNFLRWFLPPLLLNRGSMLLHSSACCDDQGRAFVCLGASGAGKSTIIGMTDSQNVLGDDMNILSIENGRCFVEAAAVGQAVQNSKLIGRKFPVSGFFILDKSVENRHQKVDSARAALSLYAGAANIFNRGIADTLVADVQSFVVRACQLAPFYNLQFSLDRKVWDYVERTV